MPNYKPLLDLSENLNNTFTGLLFGAILLMFLLRFLIPKRYMMNIKAPNVYIFEYEAQTGYLLSIYNILTLLIKLFTYVIFTLVVLILYKKIFHLNIESSYFFIKLFLTFVVYIFIKITLEEFYLRAIKKDAFISKIRFIRLSYENYLAFYLFIIAFLIYFFYVKNYFFFIITISISVIWFMLVLLNFYNSLTKHIDVKKYQIILYLCISEILPFISIIGWIIFQIL